MVKQIAERTADLIALGQPIADSDITFNEDYAFPEYGTPSEETLDTIRLCAAGRDRVARDRATVVNHPTSWRACASKAARIA